MAASNRRSISMGWGASSHRHFDRPCSPAGLATAAQEIGFSVYIQQFWRSIVRGWARVWTADLKERAHETSNITVDESARDRLERKKRADWCDGSHAYVLYQHRLHLLRLASPLPSFAQSIRSHAKGISAICPNHGVINMFNPASDGTPTVSAAFWGALLLSLVWLGFRGPVEFVLSVTCR